MSARYWTPLAQELLNIGSFTADAAKAGVRLIEAGDSDPYLRLTWWLVEDDDAPADFNGAKVDLSFSLGVVNGVRVVEVCDRRVIGS